MRGLFSNVLVCPTAEAVAEEVAERLISAAVRSVASRGQFHVAIPGGSSPRGAYQYLSRSQTAREVPWGSVQVYFTDERCVPPTHEDSNYRLAKDLLLSKASVPADNVHRFPAELPPTEAAVEYERSIKRAMGDTPRFDLVILGMGEDGHTASLFPDSPALSETGRLAVACFVPRLKAYRLTLTVPVLANACEVLIIAMGQAKAVMVRDVLRGPVDGTRRPVQLIRPPGGRLLWVLNQAAASEL